MRASTRFGQSDVRRVIEWVGPIRPVEELFPDTPRAVWDDNRDWLEPEFLSPDRGFRAAIQTWVIEASGQTILIDTGIGNDRDRPQIPAFAHLRSDFLARLSAAGVDRDAVDIVVNTHIHYDHVGWNTTLVDGEWVPTFPNARYFVPRRDREYFHPNNGSQMRAPRTQDERARFDGIRLVYADSIEPIETAGQLVTWDGEHRLTDTLRLELAPGHTPGSSVAWLEDGDGAVFVGDLTHSPIQILRPGDACSFDLNPAGAAAARRRVFAAAAKRCVTVLPAHYPGHGGGVITANSADGYGVSSWAPFESV